MVRHLASSEGRWQCAHEEHLPKDEFHVCSRRNNHGAAPGSDAGHHKPSGRVWRSVRAIFPAAVRSLIGSRRRLPNASHSTAAGVLKTFYLPILVFRPSAALKGTTEQNYFREPDR